MLVLTILFCMLLVQLDLAIAYTHLVQTMATSRAIMHIFSLVSRNHVGLAVHAAKETVKLLQKHYIPEALVYSVSHHLAHCLSFPSALLCGPLTVLTDREMGMILPQLRPLLRHSSLQV